jgi:putative membrane protein
MKRTAALAMLLGLPAIIWGANPSPDQSFYKKAAEGGVSEVELGKLAQEKGQSQAVKDFGAMMVKDHTAGNEKLKSVASTKGIIDLPTTSSVGQMSTKAKLEVLQGAAFDKSYVKNMVSDHEEDIKEFEKEAQSGQDPDAKAFAKATLPTLKAHLTKIRAIASGAGVKQD